MNALMGVAVSRKATAVLVTVAVLAEGYDPSGVVLSVVTVVVSVAVGVAVVVVLLLLFLLIRYYDGNPPPRMAYTLFWGGARSVLRFICALRGPRMG